MSHYTTMTDAQATHYLPIAHTIAWRFRRTSIDVDDMTQEAMLKAVPLCGWDEPYVKRAMANGIIDYIRHQHPASTISWPNNANGEPMDVADLRSTMLTCPHCGGIIPNAVHKASGEPTLQEREIWKLLSEPLTEKEIAGKMQLCPKTVAVHIHNLYVKLGVRNRIAAIRLGVEQGLIQWEKKGVDAGT